MKNGGPWHKASPDFVAARAEQVDAAKAATELVTWLDRNADKLVVTGSGETTADGKMSTSGDIEFSAAGDPAYPTLAEIEKLFVLVVYPNMVPPLDPKNKTKAADKARKVWRKLSAGKFISHSEYMAFTDAVTPSPDPDSAQQAIVTEEQSKAFSALHDLLDRVLAAADEDKSDTRTGLERKLAGLYAMPARTDGTSGTALLLNALDCTNEATLVGCKTRDPDTLVKEEAATYTLESSPGFMLSYAIELEQPEGQAAGETSITPEEAAILAARRPAANGTAKRIRRIE